MQIIHKIKIKHRLQLSNHQRIMPIILIITLAQLLKMLPLQLSIMLIAPKLILAQLKIKQPLRTLPPQLRITRKLILTLKLILLKATKQLKTLQLQLRITRITLKLIPALLKTTKLLRMLPIQLKITLIKQVKIPLIQLLKKALPQLLLLLKIAQTLHQHKKTMVTNKIISIKNKYLL